MRDYIVLDVEMFSNIDRVIVDIIFNGADLGVMNKYGGTGTITGGAHSLWGTDAHLGFRRVERHSSKWRVDEN